VGSSTDLPPGAASVPAVTICLMLKAPRIGRVKTRLAREVGDERAVSIYRALAEHQARQIPAEWRAEVHFAPADAENEMRDWLAPHFESSVGFHQQPEGHLGERLRAALDGAFGRGAGVVLMVGGDCPSLTGQMMKEAVSLIQSHDLVIVPALDGGYVLIGFRAAHPVAFADITWSSPAVLEETKTRARENGLSLHLFAPMEDVDDLPSLLRMSELPWAAELKCILRPA
jgi:rSAM/selenodomain-associated transferase 1